MRQTGRPIRLAVTLMLALALAFALPVGASASTVEGLSHGASSTFSLGVARAFDGGLSEQKIFFYAADPYHIRNQTGEAAMSFKAEDDRLSAAELWHWMGTGTMQAVSPDEAHGHVVSGTTNLLTPCTDDSWQEVYDAIYENTSFPSAYVKEEDGCVRELTYDASDMPGKNTYHIVWVRAVVSNGAWKAIEKVGKKTYDRPGWMRGGKTGMDGTNGTTYKSYSGYQYHVDGYIVENDSGASVRYRMVPRRQRADGTYEYLTDEAYFLDHSNLLASRPGSLDVDADVPEHDLSYPNGFVSDPYAGEKAWFSDTGCQDRFDFGTRIEAASTTLYAPVDIVEPGGFRLPRTGGAGTARFAAAGSALALVAGLLLVGRRRR